MKTKFIISIWALGLLAWVNFSCEDAKNGEVDNLIYFSEAASAKTKLFLWRKAVQLRR